MFMHVLIILFISISSSLFSNEINEKSTQEYSIKKNTVEKCKLKHNQKCYVNQPYFIDKCLLKHYKKCDVNKPIVKNILIKHLKYFFKKLYMMKKNPIELYQYKKDIEMYIHKKNTTLYQCKNEMGLYQCKPGSYNYLKIKKYSLFKCKFEYEKYQEEYYPKNITTWLFMNFVYFYEALYILSTFDIYHHPHIKKFRLSLIREDKETSEAMGWLEKTNWEYDMVYKDGELIRDYSKSEGCIRY